MKQILLFLLIATSLNAQNFKVENDVLNWQKIYTDSASIEDLNLQLKKSGHTTFLSENTLDFEYNFSSKSLEPYGFKSMSYATYIQFGGFYKGFIEFKDEKYRVTITKIEVRNALDPNIYLDISEFIIKKGEVRTQKHHQKVIKLLDAYFSAIFKAEGLSDW